MQWSMHSRNIFALAIVSLLKRSSKSNLSAWSIQHKTGDSRELDRTVLPVRHPDAEAITEMDTRNVEKQEAFKISAPDGAPNIIVLQIEKIGFGVDDVTQVADLVFKGVKDSEFTGFVDEVTISISK